MKLSGAGLRKDAYYRSNVIRVSEGPYGRSRSWTSAKPTNVPSMVELRPFGAHQLSAQSSNAGRAGHSVAAAAAGWAPAMDSIDEDTVRLMDRLTDTFKSADTNGDGVLSRDELRSVLERVGSGTEPVPMQWMTDEDLDQIFQTYDANGDGVISYEEFQALAQDKVFLTKALAEYREAFRSFDTGGNGKISPTELCALFTKLDSPLKEYSKIVDLMAKYDVNNDGEIDFGEFLRLCRNESALPLKEILQYAATRPAQREPQAPTIPASPAAPVLEPLGVTMITSEAEFTAAMDAHPDKVVVLLASLSWCRPCKKVLPQYNKLAAVYSEAIFLRFNGNENEDTKALFKTKLKARVTPSFFFFKAGELLGTCTGANATRFETNLRSHLPANAMPAEMLYPEEAPVAA